MISRHNDRERMEAARRERVELDREMAKTRARKRKLDIDGFLIDVVGHAMMAIPFLLAILLILVSIVPPILHILLQSLSMWEIICIFFIPATITGLLYLSTRNIKSKG